MNYFDIDSFGLVDCPRTVKPIEKTSLVVNAWLVKELCH